MAGKIVESVTEHIVPIINEMGYDVLEIEYKKEQSGMNLTFVISKEGGISIDDCEKVHKAIDAPLDKLNPTNDAPYVLNVSSPSADRPIKDYKDYLRNKDREVELHLFSKVNGQKDFKGFLTDYNENTVTIKTGDKEFIFEHKAVSQIKPLINFK